MKKFWKILIFSSIFSCYLKLLHGFENDTDFEVTREDLRAESSCTGKIKRAFQCSNAGTSYEPDESTTCTCIGFLKACCVPKGVTEATTASTTTTSATTTTPSSATSTTSSSATSSTTSANPTPPPQVSPHPLDPLSEEEVRKARDIINSATTATKLPSSLSPFIFHTITLKEPEKSLLLPHFLSDVDPPKGSVPRKAFLLVVERGGARQAFEKIVNLDTKVVEKTTPVNPGTILPYTPDEIFMSERVIRANPAVAAKCAGLGFFNMSLVNCDTWTLGIGETFPQYKGKRYMIVYLYGKNYDDDNQYAHPFDFIVIYDVVEEKVVEIQDLPTHEDSNAANKLGNIVPRQEHNYNYKLKGGPGFLRQDAKNITVTSPQGPAFTVEGNLVKWQKWKFRVGFNGREGLVIYMVNYNDSGTIRPILYRASITEMFIPYGDTRPPYNLKSVFDMGEYGIGFNTVPQYQGIDVIGATHFWKGVLNNSTGDPFVIQNVLAIREEDNGILWKHQDYKTGRGVVTRSHRLCVSTIATVTNYEYIFNWCFYQDGSLSFGVQMTGIVSVNMLAWGVHSTAGHGTIVAPQINAQYHQHFFAARLDTEIDGDTNSVLTSDAISLPFPTGSSQNPYGQGFTTKQTVLTTAEQGKTKVDPESGRVWLITNSKKKHPYTNRDVGWKLMPMNGPPPLLKDDSPLFTKAGCFKEDFWVVPYKEERVFACGYYLNNSGLPEWVKEEPSASIVDKDIIIFHMFGISHVPRVEDYPIMPVEGTGFHFKPYSFYKNNPSLDVVPANLLKSRRKDEL